MTTAENKHIIKNTAWLLASEFGSRIVLFVIVVWLANYLGDAQYGILSYVFAIANILVVIADFGLSTYVIKEIARDADKTRAVINEVFGVKIALSIITLLFFVIVGVFIEQVTFTVVLCGGVAILLANGRLFVEAFFRSRERMHLEALTKILYAIVLSSVLAAIILREGSLEDIAIGYALAAAAGLLIALIVLYTQIEKYHVRFSADALRVTLVAAWPFALSIACNYLFNYLDSAMLGFYGQTTQAGWYNAAYKPIFFITALAGMIINAFFPAIAKKYTESAAAAGLMVKKLLRIQALIAIPMAVGATFVARPLIAGLYKPEFAPAALAFQILAWSTALIYLWAAYGNSLQACDRQRAYVRGFVWGVLLNVVLNVLFIPTYSLYGAAWATLLTQFFLLIWMMVHFQRIARVPLLPSLIKPAIASALMTAVLYVLREQSVLILIPVGAISYALFLYAVRGINHTDLLLLASVWKKNSQ